MSSDLVTFELTLPLRLDSLSPSEVLLALAQAFRCSIEAFGLFERETHSRLRFELRQDVARRIRTPDAFVASTSQGLEWWQLKRLNEAFLPALTQWLLSWQDGGAPPSPGELNQALARLTPIPIEYRFTGLATNQRLLLLSESPDAALLPEGPIEIGTRTLQLSRLL